VEGNTESESEMSDRGLDAFEERWIAPGLGRYQARQRPIPKISILAAADAAVNLKTRKTQVYRKPPMVTYYDLPPIVA
jgi:hypothetical protein